MSVSNKPPLQRFAMKLNRYTIGTVALKQETFSVRSMTKSLSGNRYLGEDELSTGEMNER